MSKHTLGPEVIGHEKAYQILLDMSKHTPGPWQYRRLIDANGKPYSTLYQAHIDLGPCMIWAPVGNEEQEANARLIAAAPELLAALLTLLVRNDRPVESDPDIATAWAAIVKATLGDG